MKKILLALIVTFVFTSCKKEEKPVKDYIVLSGKIDNFRKRKLTLIGYNYEKKIKFNRKTKSFTDTIRNLDGGPYMLKADKMKIMTYLSPKEDLKITADYKKRTKLPTFEGTNATISNYLNRRRNQFKLILGSAVKFFSKEEDEFISANKDYQARLNDLLTQSNLSPEFVKLEKNNIKYEGLRNLNNYQKYHRTVTSNDDFKVSSSFPNPISGLNFNNSGDFKFSNQYRGLISEILYRSAEDNTKEDEDFYLQHLETIHTKITDTLIKNYLIHKASEDGLTYTENLKEFYNKYISYSTNEKNKKEITDLYNKLKLTAKGMPSPKFVNYENFNGGTTSLDDLLGKGKYIYIDVWATWCSFCKKEVPLLKNFEVKYHGKNIDFVSINVDKKSSKAKWKKIVKQREMGGIQLFGGNKETKLQFTKDYLIKGLPRFILLDPDGKIITSNAPRPSDGDKLIEIFEELGIEENN